MSEVYKFYNTVFEPNPDIGVDLGSQSKRWANAYIRNINSVNVLGVDTLNITNLNATSATVTTLLATSSFLTSQKFTTSVGSSLVLSNSAKAYLNVNILTHNAASPSNGDVWFQSSSNTMFLSIRSGSFTYSVEMGT